MFVCRVVSTIQIQSRTLLSAHSGCETILEVWCGALAWRAEMNRDAEEMKNVRLANAT
jgi:hypothetical protein